MDLVLTLATGGVVGWLASLVMSTSRQMSLLGYVLLGVVGSFVGRWLADLLGLPVHAALAQWTVSFFGAVLLIWLVRALERRAPDTAGPRAGRRRS